MVYIFFDLGLLVLVILIVIIAGACFGAAAVNSILNVLLIPLTIILSILHIISFICNIFDIVEKSDTSPILLKIQMTIFSIGRLSRSFLEITLFACLCKVSMINYQESEGFLEIAFMFIFGFLGDLFVFAVISIISSWIDIHLEENIKDYPIITITINALFSVIFYILIQNLICNHYHTMFIDIPILKHLFSDTSILHKLINIFS